MTGERTRILEMVSAGTITVEQADQLLSALGENSDAGEFEDDGGGQSATGESFRDDFDFEHHFEGPFEGRGIRPRVRVRRPRPPRVKMRKIKGPKFGPIMVGSSKNLDFDRVVQLAALGVSPGYIRDLKKQIPDLTFDEALQLGTLGTDPSTFKEIRETFGDSISFNQALEIAAIGVDAAYIKELQESAGSTLTFDEVLQLAVLGVSPEYYSQVKQEWDATAFDDEVTAEVVENDVSAEAAEDSPEDEE